MVLLKRSMDLLPTISQSSHNHGEDQRLLIQRMDSRTQLGSGSPSLNKRRETSETTVSLRKSTDSHPTTNQSYHNHGEESRSHIQLMVSRTQNGNGSPLLNKKNPILETKVSSKEFTGSSMKTTACTQPHIQEKSTPSMVP